jgi:hypothetical protein
VHDHHAQVTLDRKHKLDGSAAELYKYLQTRRGISTVADLRDQMRSWIRMNFDVRSAALDKVTGEMLRYFHDEGLLSVSTAPGAEAHVSQEPVAKGEHFFNTRAALALPVLPSPFDTQGTRLLVDGKSTRLSADAEHACYSYAKRFLVNGGRVAGQAAFVRGFEKSLHSLGVPKGTYDYSAFVKRIQAEDAAPTSKNSTEQPTPETHPHLYIQQDGKPVRLATVRLPAGNFYTGKSKRGAWARALRAEDLTMNVSKGGAPAGWRGKIVFDPTKDYYLTWRHPDTDEIGYVYPSRANAYQKKFEEASALGSNIERIRNGVVRDIERATAPVSTRISALCTYLIDKEHFRVGEETHAEDTGTFGIGSLRAEHVTIDGDHVIFDFPGKKDEPWRRVVDCSKMPEALSLIRSCLKGNHYFDPRVLGTWCR